jgi:chemotaxis protein methyltransferase WspC
VTSGIGTIADLLAVTTGLDATSVGPSIMERAVRERMAHGALSDLQSYQALLQTQPAELQALIEAVVVPETWFLRDREAFHALASLVRASCATDCSRRRLLSLPCSTGEEAYSIALTLLDSGLAPESFQIEGIDISERAVLCAQQAVYGRNSFRGDELGFRERHFERSSRGYCLRETVRQCVKFRCGNLFAAGLLADQLYDVIFCRNVLIYFDTASQSRAVQVLQSALKPDGTLFVGPSESALLLAHGMTSLSLPQAFAFRLGAPRSSQSQPSCRQRIRRRTSLPSAASLGQAGRASPIPSSQVAAAAAERRSSAAISLTTVADLADRGCLEEAAKLCEAYLATHEPTAAALYLFGLIRDANGAEAEAVANYRMALYLDPNHTEALAQLGLLLEKQGNAAAARQVRERGRRRAQREKP